MAAVNVEGEIAELLFAKVSTIPGSYAIEYPNKAFAPPNDTTYLSVSHLPNGLAFETLSSGDTLQGILQVTIVEPQGRAGVKPQDEAGAIVAHFPKALRLFGTGVTVKITNRPTAGQSFPSDDGKTRTPITIQYHAR